MVDISKYKKPADRSKLVYPDIPSSIAPVPHSDQLPVPTPPATLLADDTESSASDCEDPEWHAESSMLFGIGLHARASLSVSIMSAMIV
jgi:hypothetical protein